MNEYEEQYIIIGNTGVSDLLGGRIGSVKVYDRVLTNLQIADLYYSEKARFRP
jgi:hypothetical protein